MNILVITQVVNGYIVEVCDKDTSEVLATFVASKIASSYSPDHINSVIETALAFNVVKIPTIAAEE